MPLGIETGFPMETDPLSKYWLLSLIVHNDVPVGPICPVGPVLPVVPVCPVGPTIPVGPVLPVFPV
jgi:hypothetical protein